MRKYVAYSYVYGEKYWVLFCTKLLRSILTESFLDFARNGRMTFLCFSSDDGVPDVVSPLLKQVASLIDIRFIKVSDQRESFLQAIRYCLDNGCAMIMLPPDTFIGGESLFNVMELNDVVGGDLCYAAPHIRVNLDGFSSAIGAVQGVIGNKLLARLALDNLHQSWAGGVNSIEVKPKNSFYSGVQLIKVGSNVYIQHRLPTYWLVNFVESDYDYFSHADLRHWDWLWPNKTFQEGRHRVIGTSSKFFAVELTESEDSVPRAQTSEELNRWGFNMMLPVNFINGSVVYSLDL